MSQDADHAGTVLIVDDDAAIRDGLSRLFRSVGLTSEAYGSTTEFLRAPPPKTAACILLDVRLPGLSGLDLQAQLARQANPLPVIVMTGHGDIPMSVRAMKTGAVDFLTKPFREQDLLEAVWTALERDRQRAALTEGLADLRARVQTLTPREAEIMGHVIKGRLNKQIASDLGIAEITVKIHRGHMMQKMGARTVVELLRMADRVGEAESPPSA
ncbi:response regulator transcription factor [Caulobacter segnis]|uniref:response regulator transcription factor n=1 Tax=Caulobacter segnis TaxID=88688 RepID=UPI0024104C6A|nr:response regulator transcription factor [Caulobacter segnis]MDG2520620.1 response regulator transcription factor [Caulobacter segnis]